MKQILIIAGCSALLPVLSILQLWLKNGRMVSGTVARPDGEPLPGMLVILNGRKRMHRCTDADGCFCFRFWNPKKDICGLEIIGKDGRQVLNLGIHTESRREGDIFAVHAADCTSVDAQKTEDAYWVDVSV